MSERKTPLPGYADQSWAILSASVAINLLALAFPMLMLQIYDRIIPHQSLSTLGVFVLAVLLAGLLEAVLRYCRAYVTLLASARFEHSAMKALVSRLLGEPLHDYELRGNGALTQTLRSISLLKSHQSGQTFQQLLDLPFSALYIGVVFALNPQMGLALLVGVLGYACLVFALNRHFPKWIASSQEADLRRGNFLNESLRYIHTIKSMTMEALMLRRHDRLQGQCAKSVTDLTMTIETSNAVGIVFVSSASVALASLGAWLAIEHRLSGGELAACLMLGVRAMGPIQRLGVLWTRHLQDVHHKQVLQQALDGPVFEVPAGSGGSAHVAIGLIAEGVTYRFPRSSADDLGPINMVLQPGEHVLIDVPAAKGRTSILQLLAGILPPHAGTIQITRGDAAAQDLRSADVAYVSSASHFFEGTLLQNISRFNERNVADALAFAQETGLADFVAHLPKGWDTVVGHAVSETLPAAYRQRISIIAALFKKPGLIFLDDPGAGLDEAGEALLLKYLMSIRDRVTWVVCSDRPAWRNLTQRTLRLPPVRVPTSVTKEVQTEVTPFIHPFFAKDQAPLNALAWSEQVDPKWQKTAQALSAQFRQDSPHLHCLQTLIQVLRIPHSPREVAEMAPYFYDELGLQHLLDTMVRLGHEPCSLRLNAAALGMVSLPCLVTLKDGQPAVLLAREEQRYKVSTRCNQERWVSAAELTEQAWVFRKITSGQAKHSHWVGLALLQFKSHFGMAALASLGAGFLLAMSPLLTMQVYSAIIPSGSIPNLLVLMAGAALALAFSYLFMRQRIRLLAYVAGRIEHLFGTTIFERILRVNPTLTEGASVGAQMARLRSFEAVRDFFTTPLASMLLELPVSLLFLGILVWVNPSAILIFVLAAVLYLMLYWTQHQSIVRATQKLLSAATERNRFMTEFLSSMRSIRHMHAEQEWRDRLFQLSANATYLNFEVERKTALSVATSNFIMLSSALGVVVISTPQVMDLTLPAGALIASMFLIWRVLSPLQILYTNVTRIERIRSAVKQINLLMNIEPEAQLSSPLLSQHQVQGRVEFSRVSHRYPGMTDSALVGLNLSVEPGQMLVLSGTNGAGKSTAIKLLLRMLTLQNGAVHLDGVDIRQYTPTALRRQFGYAAQDSQFFRATILQNLRLARPDASDADIERLLKSLGAWDDLLKLKDGLHTRLGDNTQFLGSTLMQKLNTARALITQAPVMILDEPAAHLDQQGVEALCRTIREEQHQRTWIVVTQNAMLLGMADQVAVLDKGVVRIKGTPGQVLSQATSGTHGNTH